MLYEVSTREVELVESMVHELDLIEDDTDRMQVELRHRLLGLEAQYSPIDVMFLYKVLETIGDLANQADVITSYSIHYTKLYEVKEEGR